MQQEKTNIENDINKAERVLENCYEKVSEDSDNIEKFISLQLANIYLTLLEILYAIKGQKKDV